MAAKLEIRNPLGDMKVTTHKLNFPHDTQYIVNLLKPKWEIFDCAKPADGTKSDTETQYFLAAKVVGNMWYYACNFKGGSSSPWLPAGPDLGMDAIIVMTTAAAKPTKSPTKKPTKSGSGSSTGGSTGASVTYEILFFLISYILCSRQ